MRYFYHSTAVLLCCLLLLLSACAGGSTANGPSARTVPEAAITPPDPPVALVKAAESGDARSQVKLAHFYFSLAGTAEQRRTFTEQGLQWCERAAGQGDLEAQKELGLRFMLLDVKQSAMWLEKAAAQGSAYAEYLLAHIFLARLDAPNPPTPDHKKEGMAWLVKAAERGYPYAQARLADMYAEGENVARDPVEAWKWTTLACGGFNQEPYRGRSYEERIRCESDLKKQAADLTPEQRAEGQKSVLQWRHADRPPLDEPRSPPSWM